jgi:hypothetical protein
MTRIHLFEFEDQQWFPGFLRKYVTDFLYFLSLKAGVFKKIIPMIDEMIGKTQTDTLVDLGSGSGGGLKGLYPDLKNKIPSLKIILTDFYPNLQTVKEINKSGTGITYANESVDARNVPENFKGLRTMFLSFHHFRPAEARVILQNAVDRKSGLLIFESQERSFPSILAMFLSPLSVLFTTPFIRPFSAGRLLFTYLIPIVPLIVMWDGIVSSLRTYSLEEMNELVNKLEDKEKFSWETGKIKSGPAQVLYLKIIPKSHERLNPE